jgi:hypothetical protein
MLIFGNTYIDSINFIEVSAISDIKTTTPKDIVVITKFQEPYSIAKHCMQNSIEFAIEAQSIKDALFAINFNATYIIANLELAKTLQKIATEYLWDTKVLVKIQDDNSLEEVALNSIDGVIYKNHIQRIN